MVVVMVVWGMSLMAAEAEKPSAAEQSVEAGSTYSFFDKFLDGIGLRVHNVQTAIQGGTFRDDIEFNHRLERAMKEANERGKVDALRDMCDWLSLLPRLTQDIKSTDNTDADLAVDDLLLIQVQSTAQEVTLPVRKTYVHDMAHQFAKAREAEIEKAAQRFRKSLQKIQLHHAYFLQASKHAGVTVKETKDDFKDPEALLAQMKNPPRNLLKMDSPHSKTR